MEGNLVEGAEGGASSKPAGGSPDSADVLALRQQIFRALAGPEQALLTSKL